MITIHATYSGNCNFYYVTGLSYYPAGRAKKAMQSLLTQPEPTYGIRNTETTIPVYKKPPGLYLFAQGSEDSRPYGRSFKQFIQQNNLGEVTETPAKNPFHNNKISILFIWTVNQTECKKWWTVNVLDVFMNKLRGKTNAKPKTLKL